ncbi:MAG: beta strand repeat-containing protein [Alphaproteobacteria bacterium]
MAKFTGTSGDDSLPSTTGNDTLLGLAGNDTLDGGAGNDYLLGGLGNDTFYVDNTLDKVIEGLNAGHDVVISSVSFTLAANIEDLTLTGSAITAKGNTLANILTGNSANNTLDGGLGIDSMIGNDGDDTYVVNVTGDVVTESSGGSSGSDTVILTYTNAGAAQLINLSTYQNVENLTVAGTGLFNLIGDGEDNILTGNASVNTLTGNGGEDTLDGGLGADILIGGNNDDTYVIDNSGDSITDTGGTDTIITKLTSGTYTLGAGFENLTLFGIASANITGNDGVNILTGSAGNNTLNGGLEADLMIGGAGNDTYVVDDAGDVVEEATVANAGMDKVISGIDFDLSDTPELAFVENLTLQPGVANIDGTGNDLVNIITGNAGNNTLDGGDGLDTLIGGAGNDTYIVDLIKLNGVVRLEDLVSETVSGTDTLVVRTSGDLGLVNGINGTLGATVENMDISGTGSNKLNIKGNLSNNIMTGNDWDNTIDGAAGNDTMFGGDGNDTFILSSVGDVANENSGGGAGTSDTVVIAYANTTGIAVDLGIGDYANIENLKVTGTGLYNLIGDSGDNTLAGNASINTMTGYDGDDTYVVSTGDNIIEGAGGGSGTDTVISSVTWVLGSNLENLVLSGTSAIKGTGNDLDNTLTGNAGANILDGGAGAGSDSLIGGAGNDTYIVHSVSDQIAELPGGGVDTVKTDVDFNLTTNGEDIENIIITGVLGHAITGNDRSNILTGSVGDDFLDGSLGADRMIGGFGNDAYYVDNLLDVVTESSSIGGTDLVSSSIISWTLGSNLENLSLAGSAVSGTGNALNNIITGNAANNTLSGLSGSDTLDGGGGIDRLIGGTGSDTFVFHSSEASSSTNADIILDFVAGLGGDKLDIHDILSGYSGGSITDWVDVDVSGGNTIISIDANGSSGSPSFIQIATLNGITSIIDANQLLADGNLIAV